MLTLVVGFFLSSLFIFNLTCSKSTIRNTKIKNDDLNFLRDLPTNCSLIHVVYNPLPLQGCKRPVRSGCLIDCHFSVVIMILCRFFVSFQLCSSITARLFSRILYYLLFLLHQGFRSISFFHFCKVYKIFLFLESFLYISQLDQI